MTETSLGYLTDHEAITRSVPVASPRNPVSNRLAHFFRPGATGPIYAGVGLCAVGFIVLGLGWLQVALLRDVWKQMPYVLSAGFPGIGLVLVGLVMVNIAVRRRDMEATRQQLADVAEAVRAARGQGPRS